MASGSAWYSARSSSGDGTLVCEEHPGMSLIVYCLKHDAVLCSTCMTLHHSGCTGFQPLSDSLANTSNKKDSKTLQKNVEALIQQLSRLKGKRQEEKKKLKEETEKAIKDLEDFRSLINMVLDTLERKGKEYIQKRYKNVNTEVVEEITKCDEMLRTLEKLKSKAENGSKNVSVENFVKLKKGKHAIKKVEIFCSDMKNHQSRDMVKFTVDPKVENFARSLAWFGKDRNYLSFEQPVSFPHLYQIKSHNQFDIRIKGDKQVCHVVDMCQLPDGTVLAVDAANKAVKQLDVLYQVVDSCTLPGEPTAVCRVSEQKAAVALKSGSDNTIIQYLEVKNSIELADNVIIPGQCFGLACDGNQLFVSNGESASIFPIALEKPGESLCTLPAYCLELSVDSKWLVVVSDGGRIVVMNKSGEILREVTNTNITSSSKVSVDQNRQIFVSIGDPHMVVQYNHDLQELGVVLSPSDGIKQTQAIVFDRIHNRLVVAIKCKNVVKVFDLT